MKYFTFPLAATAIALTMFSVSANATGWGNGPTNNTTNNYDNSTSNYDNSTTNNPVANGGAGGVGVGIGLGGQGGAGGNANQNQGQNQGQGQSQTAKSNSNSNSNSVSGSVSGAYSGGNTQGNDQKTNVTVEGDNYEAPEIPVASAYAAGLTSANGTCMGSSSGGAQFMNTGVTFGSTWMDADCDRRYDAATLKSIGLPEAAAALMCQKAEVKESMKRSLDPAKFAQLCGEAEKTESSTETASVKSPVAGQNWFKSTDGNICYSEYKPSCVRP